MGSERPAEKEAEAAGEPGASGELTADALPEILAHPAAQLVRVLQAREEQLLRMRAGTSQNIPVPIRPAPVIPPPIVPFPMMVSPTIPVIGEELPVRVLEKPAVRGRAPTLLAGTFSGRKVEVWAPSRKKMLTPLITQSAASAFIGAVALCFRAPFSSVLGYMVASGVAPWLLPLVKAQWRPCYITTDYHGLGVTTWRGARSFWWTDIVAFAWGPYLAYLYLASGERVAINLLGYSDKERDSLRTLVADRADLSYHQYRWRVPGLRSPHCRVRSGLQPQREGRRGKLGFVEH